MKTAILVAAATLALFGCSNDSPPNPTESANYQDNSGRDDVLSGGVKMIPVETPKETFRVWTKRVGNNPTIKVLLLQWPEPVNRAFKHLNAAVYVPMQGPSELGASGKLAHWDRTDDLDAISIPTLVIGARYDTMDPKHLEWMAGAVQNGRYLYCPNGSHLAQYDDQETYFAGLINFVRDVDSGRI